MTKVVTFGAFVEILPGVEGLVHISELAQHHVENPREVVSQGEAVNVRILEIDGERRRLSLSLKRVEEGDQPVPRADGAESVHTMPDLQALRGGVPDRRLRRRARRGGDVADEVAARLRRGGSRRRGRRELPRSIVAEVVADDCRGRTARPRPDGRGRAAELAERGDRRGRGRRRAAPKRSRRAGGRARRRNEPLVEARGGAAEEAVAEPQSSEPRPEAEQTETAWRPAATKPTPPSTLDPPARGRDHRRDRRRQDRRRSSAFRGARRRDRLERRDRPPPARDGRRR